jgi:hypothetical protein
MKSLQTLYRTGFVLSVIILFVSTSVMPCISEDIEKTSSVLIEKTPENFSRQSEGLLAYWSFDEGSGIIAYDYSGHDYDGGLHGADWIYGYSGYALDFDGIGDYVYMDAHSEDLGFNKSDDYKISVWIKSNLTETGKIYEISDFSDYTPTAHVKLNGDGTLEAKVSSTTSCDVEIRTTESYNDDLWHYIECIYHGNQSYPTLELYVDEELVGSDTDWLCPMSSHQFKKAKIGITSYDTTQDFDGIMDEFKVYKKPEGNQPPNTPNISGPTTGTVGEEYSYTFVTTDPDGENVFYWIDWGDNNNTGWIGPYNSDEEIILSHIWSENGIYEIKTKAKDVFDMSEWSDPLLVAMGNLAPNAPSITGPTNGKKGEEYEYTFVSTDLNGHDIKYYIEWGDYIEEWTDFYTSGEEVKLRHTWSNQGAYNITAKAKDILDTESEWSEQFIVNITQKTFIIGLITNMSSNEELTTFKAKLLFYLTILPFNSKFCSSRENIIISDQYIGRINERFIIGIFDAAIV